MKRIPPALIYLAIGIVIVCGAYLYGKRVSDKEARIKELETQLDTLKKQESVLKDNRIAIQTSTSESVQSVRQTRASIRTPEQAIQDVNTNLQTHIGIVPQENSAANVPDAPSILSIPHNELPIITNAITNYKVLDIQYQGCKKELGVCDEQLANKDLQIGNLEKQIKEIRPSRFRNCLGDMGSNTLTGTFVGAMGQKTKEGAIVGFGVGLTKCLVFR